MENKQKGLSEISADHLEEVAKYFENRAWMKGDAISWQTAKQTSERWKQKLLLKASSEQEL